ncbi:MAG: HEAT repeat domain-containing protein [Planctomycetota bacterium]|nr:HEAT repeat domain-containing protein [Planctomycetota bacterium]
MLRRLVIWLSVLMACAILYRSSAVWCEEEAPAEAKSEEKAAAEAKEEAKGEEQKPAEEAKSGAEDGGEAAKAEEKPAAEAKEEAKGEEQKPTPEVAEGKKPAAEKTAEGEAPAEKTALPAAAETAKQPEEERVPWWRRGRRAVNYEYEDEDRPVRREPGRATAVAKAERHKKSEGAAQAEQASAEAAASKAPDSQKSAKIKELVDTIRSSLDYRCQSKAAQDIIALGPPTAPEVLALLNDSAPLVRVFGVLILREIKDQTAVAALYNLLNDADAQIRYHAGLALTKITGRNLGYYYNENPEDRQIAIQRVAEILVQGGYMPAPAKAEKQAEAAPAAPAEQKSGLEVVSGEKPKGETAKAPKAEKPPEPKKVKEAKRKKAETVQAPPAPEKKKTSEPIKAEEVGSARPPKWESESPRRLPNPDDY